MKVLTVLLLFASAMPVAAQSSHAHAHGTHGSHGASTPSEPGQDTFGALAEIVALLRADPTTDWSNVDLEALRQHLIDMEQLILRTEVTTNLIPGGAEFLIDLSNPDNAAAGRMVPAHAGVLLAETGWASQTRLQGQVLSWQVTAPDSEAEIQALGFFGLMATGNHHPVHHLAMARGEAMH